MTTKQETQATQKNEPKLRKFEHPDAFQVIILTPFDKKDKEFVELELRDDFAYLETPPAVVMEIGKEQLVPGTVLYVSHPASKRVKTPSGRYEQQSALHVSEPVYIKEYYATHKRHGGLNMEKLEIDLFGKLANDIKGRFYILRRSADGEAIKIHST